MPLKPKARFVVDRPSAYVLGTQRIVQAELDRFLIDEGFDAWTTTANSAGEILCEIAGRLCYLSFGGGREHPEYVANIKRQRHGSVIEHAVATFILTGVSRSFTHECVRHRAGWSYSQLSQRFVAEQHAQMVCPGAIAACRDDPAWSGIYLRWLSAVEYAQFAYDGLASDLALKLCPPDQSGKVVVTTGLRKLINGAARSVLPNATETKIACTVNARAFRHFLEMRASQQADGEIRSVAMTLYRAMLPHWPEILADYVVRADEDGDEYLTTEFIKV